MDTTKDTTMQHVTDVSIVLEAAAEFIAGLLERLEAAEKERDNYKSAYSEWTEKTEWVQRGITNGTIPPKYLRWHRVDVVADLLSAAEKDIALKERIIDSLGSTLNAVAGERDALLARIAAMEKQEPSHWGCIVLQSDGRWKEEVSREAPPEGYFSVRDAFPLYLAPGAKGE